MCLCQDGSRHTKNKIQKTKNKKPFIENRRRLGKLKVDLVFGKKKWSKTISCSVLIGTEKKKETFFSLI